MSGFSKTVLRTLSEEYSNLDQFKDLLKFILIQRVSGSIGNTKVQEFIEQQMSNLGWTISKDRFVDDTPKGNKTFTNIIATYDPRAAQRLLLVCHFDSKEMPFDFLAATDSAVPCAMLIDLAISLNCLLKKAKSNGIPQTTVELVFLDGEEAFVRWQGTDNTYGARHLAQLWKDTPDRHDSSKNMLETISDFVLLDLIGTSTSQFKNMFESTSPLYEKLYDIELKLQNSNYLTRKENGQYHSYFANQPIHQHLGIEDDHIPFLNNGVNILHLISLPFPGVWHKKTDNLQALDFTSIDNFNRIFRVFVSSYLRLDVTKNSCKRK